MTSNSHSLLRHVRAAGLAIGLMAAGLPAPAAAADEDVVARVNGTEITEADVAMALADIGEGIPQMPEAEKREYVITYLTDLALVAAAAEAAGIGEDADFKRQVEYARKRRLMETYLTREGEAAVNDEAALALYDDVLKDMPPEPRVRARHILVETRKEAKEVKDAIDGGKDFAEVAKEKSKDPGSGAEGGDLGWFTAEQMVPEFSEAAFALDVGAVSDPVKSDFGWHVIKVEEKADKPSFNEVKDQVYELLARQKQRDVIVELREDSTIERLDQPAGGEEEAEEEKPAE